MKALFGKMMGLVPALAMVMAISSVSATCHFILYQPDVPEELKLFG